MSKNFCCSGLLVVATTLSVVPTVSFSQGGLGALYTVVVPSGEFGSPSFVEHLASSLASARAFCGELDNSAYQVDCLAERFSVVSDSIPEGSDYDEVRKLLNTASQDMAKLAQNNRDRDLPRGRASRVGGAAESTTRPLTAVSAGCRRRSTSRPYLYWKRCKLSCCEARVVLRAALRNMHRLFRP